MSALQTRLTTTTSEIRVSTPFCMSWRRVFSLSLLSPKQTRQHTRLRDIGHIELNNIQFTKQSETLHSETINYSQKLPLLHLFPRRVLTP
jgi:hypothetical protein